MQGLVGYHYSVPEWGFKYAPGGAEIERWSFHVPATVTFVLLFASGIAVSLIGRNHPVGIVLAALLFGALFQGGAELAFEIPGFSRDMVTTLQGLIVLFSGAMARVAAPGLAALLRTARALAPQLTGRGHG